MMTAETMNVDYVTAGLNYLVPMKEKPFSYYLDPPPGAPKRTMKYETHDLPIYNARGQGVTLEKHGMQLEEYVTGVQDFYDEDEVKNVFYPETEEFVRDLLKADKALSFHHTVRSGPEKLRHGGPREPVKRVHADYTVGSGPDRVRAWLEPDEAEMRLQHRYAIINLWLPLKRPVLDAPLAVCDTRTVADSDLVAQDLIYPDRVGEVYCATYNPAHEWFYYPQMTPRETLLFKCYDSATDGRSRFAIHTAFDDPTVPADAPPRESIEVRMLVFFPPDA